MSQQMTFQQAMQLAIAHHEAGRLREAELLYRQILQAQPRYPDALHLLGVIAHQANQHAAAIDLINQAIAIHPNEAAYFSNLGEAYRAANQIEQALRAFQNAIALKPHFAEAWSNLGNVLGELKRSDEAIEACRKAIALKPDLAPAYNNMGNALEDKQRFEEAIENYRKAIALHPGFAKAWSNLGITLHQRGATAEATQAYENAIKADPNFADAHWNYSLGLLLTGQLAQGWEEYEWRWQSKDFPSPVRNFPQPLYHRQDLAGKTILLHAEQGFGDAIQFARYAPLVARRAAKVIIDVQPELHRLFESLEGVASVHDRGSPLPPFDYHAPFLSLPRAFGTDLSNIPQNVPYLKANPAAVDRWKTYLAQEQTPRQKSPPPDNRTQPVTRTLNVGLVWAGRPTHREDRYRSLPLTAFAPLFQVPNVRFVSLQKGPPTDQIISSGLALLDPAEELHDFADTAALVSALDLVISVDTAIVHLAGSLAVPVWTLITWTPDWRWLENRNDTPWYPAMRLFRQPQPNDWQTVLADVHAALQEKAANRPQ